jgi:hypothetical protein
MGLGHEGNVTRAIRRVNEHPPWKSRHGEVPVSNENLFGPVNTKHECLTGSATRGTTQNTRSSLLR